MDYSFSVNQYDSDGHGVDRGVYVNIGDITTIKFQDSEELEKFCLRILSSLPDIRSME
tara:strand:+ start:294 stop:467 length:174 start_codon:yes stop_codon:yes gene_type:complete